MTRPLTRNLTSTADNRYQSDRIKTLCVCSAGLLRSPTAAVILAQEFNRNTRACGCEPEYALICIDQTLVYWADEIVVMDTWHAMKVSSIVQAVKAKFPSWKPPVVFVLDVPDEFEYMQPELQKFIKASFQEKLDQKVFEKDLT